MESRDRLLSALHEIQDRSPQNYVSPDELDGLSHRFGLTMAELRGVSSYYSMISLEPRGRHIVRVCVSPVCRMLGALDLLGLLKAELGIEVGETDPEGLFTLEETQCLGHCAGAPAMMVGARVYEGLDVEGVRGIIAAYRKARDHG
ncbi:MAG TPA: NAD(P)H-dependent oxidoreductase subunit E [Rectinemataceae bacterium]|nr:NAD(P)H-dependent oxidoreductase subunit E [Rectinemataceae bacterium]